MTTKSVWTEYLNETSENDLIRCVALSEDIGLNAIKQKAEATWDVMTVDIKLENWLCISEAFIFCDLFTCDMNLDPLVQCSEMQEQTSRNTNWECDDYGTHQNTC
jgi:hypothetical protein